MHITAWIAQEEDAPAPITDNSIGLLRQAFKEQIPELAGYHWCLSEDNFLSPHAAEGVLIDGTGLHSFYRRLPSLNDRTAGRS